MDDDRDPLLEGEPVEIDDALLPELEDDDKLFELDDDGNVKDPLEEEEEDLENIPGFTTEEPI